MRSLTFAGKIVLGPEMQVSAFAAKKTFGQRCKLLVVSAQRWRRFVLHRTTHNQGTITLTPPPNRATCPSGRPPTRPPAPRALFRSTPALARGPRPPLAPRLQQKGLGHLTRQAHPCTKDDLRTKDTDSVHTTLSLSTSTIDPQGSHWHLVVDG